MSEKYSTYLITISVKGDLDDECAKDIKTYLAKKCRWIYAVLEYADKWHMHAACCYKNPTNAKSIKDSLWEKVKEYHADSVRKHAIHLSVMYNHNWFDTYLHKSESTKVLIDDYDKEQVGKLFPSIEQQEALIKITKTTPGEAALCPFWQRLLTGYEEHASEYTYKTAIEYIKYCMVITYEIKPITDPRKYRQMAAMLVMLKTKDYSMSHGDERYYMQETDSMVWDEKSRLVSRI